jgi:hypothetical protein
VGHFDFELEVFRYTPTGNQLGPPSTSFSRAERLHPTGVRLRSARYARLRSASPRRGEGGGKKDKLQKDFYTPRFGFDPYGESCMFMSKRTFAVVLIVGGVIGVFIFRHSRPIARDFCEGTLHTKVIRLDIEGQGLKATLTNDAVIAYLVQRPKLHAAPPGYRITNGFSFEVTIYDPSGSRGQFQWLISDDKRLQRLGYFKSLMDDATFTVFTIETNAPTDLMDMLDFLLSETNRGKFWRNKNSISNL